MENSGSFKSTDVVSKDYAVKKNFIIYKLKYL